MQHIGIQFCIAVELYFIFNTWCQATAVAVDAFDRTHTTRLQCNSNFLLIWGFSHLFVAGKTGKNKVFRYRYWESKQNVFLFISTTDLKVPYFKLYNQIHFACSPTDVTQYIHVGEVSKAAPHSSKI